MHINNAWQDVDTVLLDMDGTLLDLAFDNYFWQKLVPETWGAKNGVTPQERWNICASNITTYSIR